MAITIDVNYSNSFYLKRIYASGNQAGNKPVPYPPEGASVNAATGYASGFSQYSWTTPIVKNNTFDWMIEESRIRGGFNNTQVELGPKAYLKEDSNAVRYRNSALIYSGIFNSRTE